MTNAVKKVLIIEDDAWLAEHYARRLEKLGYQIRQTDNGIEGIEIIDNFRPDVIILDILLPGPNGLVLLHELQSHSDLAVIPVIVCSSIGAVPEEDMAIYGVREVIDKSSMDLDSLEVALGRVML